MGKPTGNNSFGALENNYPTSGKSLDFFRKEYPVHIYKVLGHDIKYFEPKVALDGGKDGLDVIKKVIYKAKKLLRKKGILAIEIGNKQYTKVSKILRINRFRKKHLISDYRRNIRCVVSILEN